MINAKTYGLTHLSMAVKDLNSTLRFYEAVFDMEVMYQEEAFIQLTTPGTHDVLVFTENKAHETGNTRGINHFGFRLKDPKDIDEIVQKVIAAGGTIIDKGEFVRNSPYVFFKDLDGYEVEVWYEK